MAISLGAIEFDESIIKRHLRRDLLDDWFPDPRRFEDMIDSDYIERVLRENFSKNDGAFRPEYRTLLNIPKGNFTLRYGLEVGLAERALYQALVTRLVQRYDPLIPWNVFSHRASEDPLGRYLFRRAIPAWQDFTGVVKNALGNSSVLLTTDLTNYFENINLTQLRDTLISLLPEIEVDPLEKAAIRGHIGVLFDCLRSWCYSDSAGIPQNRDASSFLANVYMLPVDRAMLGQGYSYFRYMDDIKIVCKSTHEARLALKKLSLELRGRGLAVNSGKTAIIPTSGPAEVKKYLDEGESELQSIDSIWQTRSLRPIQRSFPLLSDLTQRLLKAGEVGGRPFRYCIRRLEALAICPEFEVPEAYFAPITPLVIDALSEYPACTDELTRYIRAVPTSEADLTKIGHHICDSSRNYYTWQNYRLWILLVQKSFKEEGMLSRAIEIVRSEPDNATRCGATLYVGAFGDKELRVEIAKNFPTIQSFIGQRAALLAMQELHFNPYIRDYVAPTLRDDLKGVYRQLNREGKYVAPPEPFAITRVLDSERDYD